METKQIGFNLQLPKEVLNRLRKESKETGIPVSALIKIALKKYSEDSSRKERSPEELLTQNG